ncbi:helix-turn-helix domain-containing protein [Patescibacteria group bacterium]|nr:helix-turn-helix domain-containing protein [Patescibacteria group bacterium]
MEIIVFEKEGYYKMLQEFAIMVREAVNENKEASEWLNTEEAKELLGFKSKSKMQQLRDNGEIDFSQHGRIIKYSRKSCLKFLERNRVKF